MRTFVGLASYYHHFVYNFAAIARPVHRLTEKGVELKWDSESLDAFDELKRRLAIAPVLGYPHPQRPFILDTSVNQRANWDVDGAVGLLPICHCTSPWQVAC